MSFNHFYLPSNPIKNENSIFEVFPSYTLVLRKNHIDTTFKVLTQVSNDPIP